MALLVLLSSAASLAAQVVVVESTGSRLYGRAVDGFSKEFKGAFQRIAVKGDLKQADKLAEAVRKEDPQVLVAVGLGAAKLLLSTIHDRPIVFCMANNPVRYKLKRDNSAGVFLEPSPGDQLKAYKRLLPKAKRIGILYDEKSSGRFVKRAKKAASNLGLSIEAIRIERTEQIPDALQKLADRVDALWLLRDARVMSRAFFEQTILLQYNRKLPVLAYSNQFVKKGAVASFSADYHSQGRMAARLVRAILNGQPAGELGIVSPEGHLCINRDAAVQAGLDLPSDLLQGRDVKTVGGKGGP